MAPFASRARAARRWLVFWRAALVLLATGGVALGTGWVLHRAAERYALPRRRLAAAAAGWALAWTLATRLWWLRAFYRAVPVLILGGYWPRHGAAALAAGWVFWTLAVGAGVPAWRSFGATIQALALEHGQALSAFLSERGAGELPAPRTLPDGVELGRDEQGLPVVLSDDQANVGVVITGGTGAGKTTVERRISASVLRRGPALIFIDGKGSVDLRRFLEATAAAAGRTLHTWSFAGPAQWNPLAHGSATQRRDAIMGMTTWSEEHYRLAAEDYLARALQALEAAGRPVTLEAVADVLDPDALQSLCRPMEKTAPEQRKRLGAFLNRLEHDDSGRSAVSGLAHRVGALMESEARPWLAGSGEGGAQAGAPSVDLLEVALEGGAALFSLDSLLYPDLTAQVAALLVQDVKSVAGELLARGNRRPVYVLIDEFNVFRGTQVLPLFNKGREAGLCCVLATQDPADIVAAGGTTLTDQLLANAGYKVLLRMDVAESARRMAAPVGTRPAWTASHRTWGGLMLGEGTVREAEVPVLSPSELLQLPPYHAVVVEKVPGLRVRRVRLHPDAGAVDGGAGTA